jgi:hypothetical protein
MRPRPRYWTGFVAAALCLTAMAQEGTRAHSDSDVSAVAQQLEKSQRSPRREIPYEVVRNYRFYSGGSAQSSSEVVAEIQYLGGDETYVVQKRTVTSTALLTGENYVLTDLEQGTIDGQSHYLLGLTPKRRQKELIAGRAWIDKWSFLVRRIEGQLAKSPSWWLKNVYVKLDFVNLSGTAVQTTMEASADVRLIGKQILRSQTLDYRRINLVATKATASQVVTRGIAAELLLRGGFTQGR